MRTLLIVILLFALGVANASSNVVNVYNWSDYIPNKVIQMFEKQTGIKVNYSTYSNNEELYEKLKADPNAGYDVVVPSSYFVQRMAIEGMLHKLDLKKLPNIKNINPSLLNRAYDPGNHYSIPYLWGTTSIVVNKKFYDPKTITSWNDLWDKRFHNQVLLMNDMRDVFSMALASLGYSVNTRDPKKIEQAYQKLLKLLPNVKVFSSDGSIPIFIDEDVAIGMAYNGDVEEMQQSNSDLVYVYPKKGVIIWTDCMCIPKYAPHLANAYKFINFIMQPKIAKMIGMQLGYSSPNMAAVKLMPKSVRSNPTIYPSQKILRTGQTEAYVGQKTLALYSHYWELLKIAA